MQGQYQLKPMKTIGLCLKTFWLIADSTAERDWSPSRNNLDDKEKDFPLEDLEDVTVTVILLLQTFTGSIPRVYQCVFYFSAISGRDVSCGRKTGRSHLEPGDESRNRDADDAVMCQPLQVAFEVDRKREIECSIRPLVVEILIVYIYC